MNLKYRALSRAITGGSPTVYQHRWSHKITVHPFILGIMSCHHHFGSAGVQKYQSLCFNVLCQLSHVCQAHNTIYWVCIHFIERQTVDSYSVRRQKNEATRKPKMPKIEVINVNLGKYKLTIPDSQGLGISVRD